MAKTKHEHEDEARARYRIKVTRDGPYIVRGGVPLSRQIIVSDANGDPLEWRPGEPYQVGDTYSLCRCGRSTKWPLCDGTHHRANFDGSETAGREAYLDQPQETEGPTVRLADVGILCAHAAFCDRCGGTWDLTRRSDEPEARQTAIDQASNCPSGRLMAFEKDGTPIEPELEPSIGVIEDPLHPTRGPYWVRGGIPIEAVDGTVYRVRNRVTLCGCGKSKNKPFCDGTHARD